MVTPGPVCEPGVRRGRRGADRGDLHRSSTRSRPIAEKAGSDVGRQPACRGLRVADWPGCHYGTGRRLLGRQGQAVRRAWLGGHLHGGGHWASVKSVSQFAKAWHRWPVTGQSRVAAHLISRPGCRISGYCAPDQSIAFGGIAMVTTSPGWASGHAPRSAWSARDDRADHRDGEEMHGDSLDIENRAAARSTCSSRSARPRCRPPPWSARRLHRDLRAPCCRTRPQRRPFDPDGAMYQTGPKRRVCRRVRRVHLAT
jgi:hypothetical protein